MKLDANSDDVFNMAEPEAEVPPATNGVSVQKKKKRQHMKVSFNVPSEEEEEDAASADGRLADHRGGVDDVTSTCPADDNQQNGCSSSSDAHAHSGNNSTNALGELEFLQRFANLRKLGAVMDERSKKQHNADKERMDAHLIRARQILKEQAKRNELAKLIPSEELNRLLEAVNLNQQYVVQRETRKYMVSKRGMTSYIYLAGDETLCQEQEQEQEHEPEPVASSYSQTFGSQFEGGLL